MLRSRRFADQFVIGHEALQQVAIDDFIVDPVTNRLLVLRDTIVLIFHHSIISRGDADYSRSGQRRELWYTRTISIVEPRTR